VPWFLFPRSSAARAARKLAPQWRIASGWKQAARRKGRAAHLWL